MIIFLSISLLINLGLCLKIRCIKNNQYDLKSFPKELRTRILHHHGFFK